MFDPSTRRPRIVKVALDPSQEDAIAAYIARAPARPSRASVIRAAIDRGLPLLDAPLAVDVRPTVIDKKDLP